MKKELKTYKNKTFYKVYHRPTKEEFYFSFKPKFGELRMIGGIIDGENFDTKMLKELEITKHTFII